MNDLNIYIQKQKTQRVLKERIRNLGLSLYYMVCFGIISPVLYEKQLISLSTYNMSTVFVLMGLFGFCSILVSYNDPVIIDEEETI